MQTGDQTYGPAQEVQAAFALNNLEIPLGRMQELQARRWMRLSMKFAASADPLVMPGQIFRVRGSEQPIHFGNLSALCCAQTESPEPRQSIRSPMNMESILSESNAPSNASRALLPQRRGCREVAAKETEECLIASALRGCDEAFWNLIQPHLASLNRLARMRLRSDPEAEDIVQQAVLRALSRLRQFRGDASFKTWITTIASNEVSQWRRRRAVAAMRPLQEGRDANLPDPANAPDIQFERRQETEHLHRALTRLPEKYRRMIQLRDLHELSIAETARSLKLTTSAVKTRHHRARKLLVRSFARVKHAA